MNIHTKACVKCGKLFDIATNHKTCHKCRGVTKKKDKRGKKAQLGGWF